MGKSSNRSAEYFFTGNYFADDDDNDIDAIGFGGYIYARGGNDYITLGSIAAKVYTGTGNDTVVSGAAYLEIEDSTGNLTVKGGAGYADIDKRGDGDVLFSGVAGGASLNHTGNHGELDFAGAAVYNEMIRKGLTGDVSFKGAGGYNKLWHEINQGNLYFDGAGAGNQIDHTWYDRYSGSNGDVTFNGAGAANSISSRIESGNINFTGAGADNHIIRKGKEGDITLRGAGASNRIKRIRQKEDIYVRTRGDITFEGIGGYNKIYSDIGHGNISFSGIGAYNEILRIGANDRPRGESLEYAKAGEIVLTTATMGGSWIQESQPVTGIKSTIEPDTYLFAFVDEIYTKISKVHLFNDPETGNLNYYSTSWYKEGDHLKDLASTDISSANGFIDININGAYRLSNLIVEHRQPITICCCVVGESLSENEWVVYAGGTTVKVEDIMLLNAKMGGRSIFYNSQKVDVSAVKSNRQPNTYVYAKYLESYTKVVVVELENDPITQELKYFASAWFKAGDHTSNLADEDISFANGYLSMSAGGYMLSQLQYSHNTTVRRAFDRLAHTEEYSQQELVNSLTNNGDSSGNIQFNGVGGGNVINSSVTRGNVDFAGGGAANVIVKSGEEGDLTFRGAGLANVIVNQSQHGEMDVNAGGAANVLVRVGDGRYLAHLLAVGNISIHKGNGNSQVMMLGGYNTHTHIGNGRANWSGAGGFNLMVQKGNGNVSSVLVGGANVLTKLGAGDLVSGMLGGGNIITHISSDVEMSNTKAIALGGANILTRKGWGDVLAVMGGGANVLTHIGNGNTTGVMLGGANILTKIGNGDTIGTILGIGNVLTHVGDGQTLGVMGAAGNIFTKVGEGSAIAAMIGAGNLFTHVGKGDAWALMGGAINLFTKVGDGNALALMLAVGNVFTHIGDGTSVALMLAKGNIATKVGSGMTLSAMIGEANIFTHVGDGNTFAAMIGGANVLTKVGNDLTAALMMGKANIYSHIGDGTSIGLFAGELNVMTKVGDGTTLAAMFGKANIMTHAGNGLTGVLALGEANIVTKVGNDFMGVVATAKANIITHVGDSVTAGVLLGKGNILTKVGDGTTVGLLISDVGNIMTHIGDGTTVGFAKGKANIITKVGGGTGINAVWGEANILTQVGNGDRYNFAKGKANIITKVGDKQEVTVVQGDINIITHAGSGDDYTGVWGEANVITKVGEGRNVVLAKGKANIVTQVGKGDSFNALWSESNTITKVGDGVQVIAAKGKANITTTVGNGLSVTATQGDLNVNTKVGNGVSVNVAWGKYNVNTKVGDGLNVAVMKGKGNANIHIGDGLGINASYAHNNVAIKIGNGDFYSLAVAESSTESNKLVAFFENIKQTALGVGGSQAINYLIQGNEANTSGTHKGRGAINVAEVSAIDGFKIGEIAPISSDLNRRLSGSVTEIATPDLDKIHRSLDINENFGSGQESNLIINGNFEQGNHGWLVTNGMEANHSASVYGLDNVGHGDRVSELDADKNTAIYQDLRNLFAGEVIVLSFDFANRSKAFLTSNGMEVFWNGKSVFSTSGDVTQWQNKTLELTAKTGSNRIEFKGTGLSDGIGYIVDNIVAKFKNSRQANAVTEQAKQDKAAQGALNDKEKAEKDHRLLEQEKDKQLAAIAETQSQLESTDQTVLNTNGQMQCDAVKEESQAVTNELISMTQGLDALNGYANYHGESGDQWRDQFASELLGSVQDKLNHTKHIAQEKLVHAQQIITDNQQQVKEAVAKSEVGVAQSEQHRVSVKQDIAEVQEKAALRKAEALLQQQQAEKAANDANIVYQDAENRGKRDITLAENTVAQVQTDAKGAKQNEHTKPQRVGASGSSLSGKAYESTEIVETGSHVNAESVIHADGRFSTRLTEEDLDELKEAKGAINRLQINANFRYSMNDQFSVEKNRKNLSTDTPIDKKEKTLLAISASDKQIANSQNRDVIKGDVLQKIDNKIFDFMARGKELKASSFHFSQGDNLLEKLDKIIPEIGSVLLTDGDKVKSKSLRKGLCFALSARYLIEERVHGSGGGKAYMMWLKDAVKAYNDTSVNKKTDINSIESSLLVQYRRQNIGPLIEDLLSMQYSQSMDSSTVAAYHKANAAYGGKLKANGLTGPNIHAALNYEAEGYESVMDKLRNVRKSTYMTFMSEDHAMSVVVDKNSTQMVWSFYDPNYGAKSFANYHDFYRFMDSFHNGYLKTYFTGYKFQASEKPDQSFYVQFNKFEKGTIARYDGVWKQAREGEQGYILRALKEQGKIFTLGSDATGRVVDYGEREITLEVTTKQGKKSKKILVEVENNNFKQAAGFVQSNINKILTYPAANKLILKASADGDMIFPGLEKLASNDSVKNKNVENWERVAITSQTDNRETRFTGQVIIQLEDDPVVAKAAANLAGKHPDSSVVVQLDSNGKYQVVYGNPSKLSGVLRWQIVGHGRDGSAHNNTRLSGYSADELAVKLKQFSQDLKRAGKPIHISIVGCSLISDDKRDGFARRFIVAMDKQGIRSDVSARRSEVAVDISGRKFTRDQNNQWVNNLPDNKIVFKWNKQSELTTNTERVIRGVDESDITLSKVGYTSADAMAKGAVADHHRTFTAPKKRTKNIEINANDKLNRSLSYTGNIQINVGEGEFTALNWGTSNVGVKVGSGGFKSLAFGDNNVMVHIGHGDSKHSFDIDGYQAFEGAQMFIGNRNVSFNRGRSNDLIVMMDKSIPTPPLVNPFDGAIRVTGVLQSIARSGEEWNWLVAQDQQWTLSGAEKFVQDMSGLDQTSSVDYKTLVNLDSQHERSSRGLKSDAEAALNKRYYQWLSGNSTDTGKMSRANKFRQANQKLAFNFAVGGRGADIQVTTGNWNLMFGDNIQSILDTNLGSLFGLMSQQFTTTGLVKTTFTYNPQDLPRQLKNKLLGRLAGVSADTTLSDIFGVDYTAEGQIVSRTGEPVDGEAILRKMLEVIGEFSGDQLKAFTNPEKLLNGLRAGIDMGTEGVRSFAESHGLMEKTPDETPVQGSPVVINNRADAQASDESERKFGFNSLNLPNLFATMFSQDKQTEMQSLMANLKENLTADLLNMEQKTFDFLCNSGHLQGDSDIHISLGNYNFNWGGDGKDLSAYLGDNNNFWGGRGDDVYYSMGTSNIFTGGEGNDMGVLMGRENWMFGGNGDDTAVVAGRINQVFMGEGNDQAFVFGEGGFIDAGNGQDYVVASGNYNRVDTGAGRDYTVIIGNNNWVDLGKSNDSARVFGNDNRIDGSTGNDGIKLMGYHAVINGGEGDDHLIAAAISKFSQFDGGDGQDLLVLGGYQNRFQGGAGVDSFMVSGEVIDSRVSDINAEDIILLHNVDWKNLWFQRSGYDLVLSVNRHPRDKTAQGVFESVGAVTFDDYFNGHRAKLVRQMGDKDKSGEREFTALSDNAVDSLIQAMSSFSPTAGDNGFIASLDSKAKIAIATAWTDAAIGKGKFA
ncbi:MARTX multifunctional-autoprocessing repeats-in-toxin holotoxin RtxA [Photorhabdus heterorhabditis]|uniref:MARTX multifunctional-autoprocessing repeats-in-toxin holotoxin RtxA n=1 Tax=Photorhabdus heterorhabditis TaxID=880156 RepID=UPI001BD31303|nr:MARTX multifunctional-autoprocessing repeats-in-toxin holotoxin RtxA [Photorhabdus heterorhabditis]MBS9443676.1 MARTX multifunctional-autoprocessing repeats-in-toxin holotoxin RtxA [Photorhabdus heterorhabditis]